MKYFFSLLLAVCTLQSAYAQTTMMMGKITDAQNVPVKGAAIYIDGNKEKPAAISDEQGLFTSGMLTVGTHNVIIVAGDRNLKAGKMHLSAIKEYYLLTLSENNKVRMETTSKNPYMASNLKKVAADQRRIDVPMRAGHYYISKENVKLEVAPNEQRIKEVQK